MSRKLRPGLAWPTRPAIVAGVLGPLADDVHGAWMTWQREATDPIHPSWEPRHAPVIGGSPGKGATLWIGPVDRSQLEAVRGVAEEMLREARRWFEDALRAGEAWQSSRHERRWRLGLD